MNNSKHIIGHVKGKHGFPTIVAFGGIHGNEKAGVVALEKVFKTIKEDNISFHGNFYGIQGNISALNNNSRFIDEDLNRIWTKRRIKYINDETYTSIESMQQKKLYSIIKEILKTSIGPFYFIDLHTTSASTSPFITISDSLSNRKFSSKFNVPIILGIEEFLDGLLLTFLSEYGHVSLGFEAGQHDEKKAIDNCEFFIWKTLALTKCINKKRVKNYSDLRDSFYKITTSDFYHIKEKHTINKGDDFVMEMGFENFQEVKVGDFLANSNGKKIIAKTAGKIFMPLYQKQGKEGFFIIKKVSSFWLGFSKFLRRIKAYEILRILPGIHKVSKNTLRVNPNKALFLRNDIFHLLGYRKRIIKGKRMFFTKRDRSIKRF